MARAINSFPVPVSPRINTVASVWRDFNGDFGRDLLKEHYQASHTSASRQ